MKTTWKIATRDLGRLLRTPAVWVILLGVLVTPALYSWLNIAAFWDPYKRTEHIPVAVVNLDRGAHTDLTGDLDVGKRVVEQLANDDNLGWQFMDATAASDALRHGDVAATITIPEDFSADLANTFAGDHPGPTLDYRVNEKLSAIGPKITDQGARGLDSTISEAFKEKVGQVASEQLKGAEQHLDSRADSTAEDTANAFGSTAADTALAREKLSALQADIDSASPRITQAQASLDTVMRTLDDTEQALGEVSTLAEQVDRSIADIDASNDSSRSDARKGLHEAAAATHEDLHGTIASLDGALSRVGVSLDGAHNTTQQARNASTQLREAAHSPTFDANQQRALTDAAADLDGALDRADATLGNLDVTKNQAQSTVESLDSALSAAEDSLTATAQAVDAADKTVDDALPQLRATSRRVSSISTELASTISAQRALVSQAQQLLGGIGKQVESTHALGTGLDQELGGIEDGLRSARTDVLALSRGTDKADVIDRIRGLDPEHTGSLLASPARLQSAALYEVDHYGSGMSSLFINLTLWVGAFMLLLIIRTTPASKEQEISGIQAYLARFLLLGFFSVGQAVIVSVGNLLLGVQHQSPVTYVGTAVLIAICYLAIVYALISALGHLGRMLAVVMAFVQIPGASGIYPIEMTPDFFRGIHPFVPFTYGVRAMRENVGGFYGHELARSLAVLLAMAVAFLFFGLVARALLGNIKSVVNAELASGGLVTAEPSQHCGPRRTLADALVALRAPTGTGGSGHAARQPGSTLRRNPITAIALAAATMSAAFVLLAHVYPQEKAAYFGGICLVLFTAVGAVCLVEYLRRTLSSTTGHTEVMDKATAAPRVSGKERQ